MNHIKEHARRILSKTHIEFLRTSTLERLIKNERKYLRTELFFSFAKCLNADYLKMAMQLLPTSEGEIFQDLFAALCIGVDRPGFFVEFGATDGVNGSNTLLLEKELGWKGILAEPGRCWRERLAESRNCTIETDCVWITTGQELEFTQTNDAGFSTVSSYAGKDYQAKHRKQGITYLVKTVSLHDMLIRSNAPKSIDYISIDTEGSELDILAHFPFREWNINLLTVEHNYREDRKAMHTLLSANGFVRVLTEQSRFDDWYVAKHLLPRVRAVFSSAV